MPFDGDSAEAMRRFARPARNGSREPDPLLCRHFRSRSFYASDSFTEREGSRSSPVAPYWCVRTMRADGPDGVVALPEDCTDERICFEAAVGPDGES
jgi:hypothetical protein